ncbi:MAG: response regulator transcription factor [Candidatus Melainabacteria bacterium]|nr:response regulator transcription factor [Candidatus Melainabacteria bacterium]
MVSILIVEDMPALREYAREVLTGEFGEDLELCEAANGAEGMRIACSSSPDLIIMDISMPELNGIKAAEEIWSRDDRARILFWSQYHRETYVRSLGKIVPDEAIHGYLLKGESDSKLAEAVRSVLLNGDPYIDPVVQGIQKRLKSRDQSLSDSEFETLLDIAVGLTDRAIARRRHISVRGVQNRLSMLLGKLVRGHESHLRESVGMEIFNPRTRIVCEALRRGLVDIDELPDLDQQTWEWIEEDFDYSPDGD